MGSLPKIMRSWTQFLRVFRETPGRQTCASSCHELKWVWVKMLWSMFPLARAGHLGVTICLTHSQMAWLEGIWLWVKDGYSKWLAPVNGTED